MQYIACIVMKNTRELNILVGTKTYTTDCVEKKIIVGCADLAEVTAIHMLDGLDIGACGEYALYVNCPTTYSAGNVHDNAKSLHESPAQTPRFLGSVRYGVIAMGGSAYPQAFSNGGQRAHWAHPPSRRFSGHRTGNRWRHAVPGMAAHCTGCKLKFKSFSAHLLSIHTSIL